MTPYLNEQQVAERRGITVDEIPFALRRGDLPMPDAYGVHREPLWKAESVVETKGGGHAD